MAKTKDDYEPVPVADKDVFVAQAVVMDEKDHHSDNFGSSTYVCAGTNSHTVPRVTASLRKSRHNRRGCGVCCAISCGFCVALVALVSFMAMSNMPIGGGALLSCCGEGACQGNTGKIAPFSW